MVIEKVGMVGGSWGRRCFGTLRLGMGDMDEFWGFWVLVGER